jgi:hypothetical protein
MRAMDTFVDYLEAFRICMRTECDESLVAAHAHDDWIRFVPRGTSLPESLPVKSCLEIMDAALFAFRFLLETLPKGNVPMRIGAGVNERDVIPHEAANWAHRLVQRRTISARHV